MGGDFEQELAGGDAMLSMRMSFLLFAASCVLFLGFGQHAEAQ